MIKKLLQATAVCCMLVGIFACNNQQKNNTFVIKEDLLKKLAKYGIDQSPMDMIFYPVDYPKLKMNRDYKKPLLVRIIYSRPQKNDREVFGELIKYGKPWRLGANEATEIELFHNTIMNHKVDVPAGKYVMYCIPEEDHWTIILNKDLYTWGLKIDSTLDVYKIKVPVQKIQPVQEMFSMEFVEEDEDNVTLVIAWDHTLVAIPFTFLSHE